MVQSALDLYYQGLDMNQQRRKEAEARQYQADMSGRKVTGQLLAGGAGLITGGVLGGLAGAAQAQDNSLGDVLGGAEAGISADKAVHDPTNLIKSLTALKGWDVTPAESDYAPNSMDEYMKSGKLGQMVQNQQPEGSIPVDLSAMRGLNLGNVYIKSRPNQYDPNNMMQILQMLQNSGYGGGM